MSRNVDIVFMAKDNFSEAVQKMKNAQTAFRKDAGELQKELNRLNNTKVSLQTNMTTAKQDLDAAKKAFKETASEADKLTLAARQADYNNMASNLKAVSKAANQTEKDLQSLTATASKAENRASSVGTAGSAKEALQESSLASRFSGAGASQMLGQLMSQAANTYVQSAFGSEAGNLFGGALAGAGSGAAIGSMIAPGIGTAIGAGLGAAAGLAQGALQNFQNKDDAFKSVVQERYQSGVDRQTSSLENGSGVASAREMTQMSFATLFKDAGIAEDYLSKVLNFADVTPFQFEDLTSMSKSLKTFRYGIDELIPTMTIIGDTGAALGMATSDMNTVATALGRMRSSGKVSLEYINMLQERGIDAVGAIGEGFGLDTGEVYQAITQGTLDAVGAVQAITDFMEREFKGAMEEQAGTYSGLMSTVQGLQNSLDAEMGAGFNETRKEGLEAQIAWLDNSEMKAAYRAMGEFQAQLENDKEQAYRDTMEEAIGTEDFQLAKITGNGAEMGRILAEAQAKAQNEYEASEGAQLQLQAQIDTIVGIREDTALKAEYYQTGNVMQQEFSRGILSAKKSVAEGLTVDGLEQNTNTIFEPRTGGDILTSPRPLLPFGKAFGMDFVPYDNFPALLHHGERVLTASEARQKDAPPQINISGSFTVREEVDIDRIAAALYEKIRLVKMLQ